MVCMEWISGLLNKGLHPCVTTHSAPQKTIFIGIYIHTYKASSESRVKGVTGSRTRSTGRSPSTERVRITAQRTLDAAETTRASRPGVCQGQCPLYMGSSQKTENKAR